MREVADFIIAGLGNPSLITQIVALGLLLMWWRGRARTQSCVSKRPASKVTVHYTVSMDGYEQGAHYGTSREQAEAYRARLQLWWMWRTLLHRLAGAAPPPRIRSCASVLGYVPARTLTLMGQMQSAFTEYCEDSGPWAVYDGKLLRVALSTRKWERPPKETCQASKGLPPSAQTTQEPPEEHF